MSNLHIESKTSWLSCKGEGCPVTNATSSINSNMIVVFYKKRFLLSKDNFKKAVEYGLKEGIPQEQLDFFPKDVADENW